MRAVNETDLVGKTIQTIDNKSVNVLKLTFTDGSKLELWAEDAVYTPFGNIPGIFAEVPRHDEQG